MVAVVYLFDFGRVAPAIPIWRWQYAKLFVAAALVAACSVANAVEVKKDTKAPSSRLRR
jgi:hypothetical protein